MAPTTRQWAHATGAGAPSRALAPLGWRTGAAVVEDQVQRLGNGLTTGGEDDCSENRLVSQDQDQFLPPVSRLQLEQQSSHFRQARNRDDTPRVSYPLYFLPVSCCSLSCPRVFGVVVLSACARGLGHTNYGARRVTVPAWCSCVTDVTRRDATARRETITTQIPWCFGNWRES